MRTRSSKRRALIFNHMAGGKTCFYFTHKSGQEKARTCGHPIWNQELLLGVELISTLLGKVLLGYELESSSRHFCTHLPADITWDRPACSPCMVDACRCPLINRHRFGTFRSREVRDPTSRNQLN